ncbi:MAG TPA: hypothetical protein VNE61_16330 [Ktedonobacteraceae bacterium]|nr:hypothetical protein [Ktedonobacteraceae bacterium]
MIHDDDELRDDDFDLEFSDLPLEGELTFAEKVVTRVMALLSNPRGAVSRMRIWLSAAFVRVRSWLLAQPERQRFADGSASDDIELELADLPDLAPTRLDGVARAFARLNTRVSYKMRLWRIVVAVCTIILTLALILSAVPQARELLFHQTLTAAPAASTSGTRAYTSVQFIQVSRSNGTPIAVVQGTTVVGWRAATTPAPAPSTCPARPNLHGSSGYGRSPVWLIGFEGGYATLNFAPPHLIPDLVFPNGFAWETSVNVEVQASYKQAISLSGQNLDDGTLIYFDYNPNQGKQSSSITLNSPQTPDAPGSMPNGSILSWSINLFFSSANCYSLHARWATGSWTLNFSAGR